MKRVIPFLVAVLFCPLILFAAPLFNHPIQIVQPSGEKLSIFASGDEFHHWMHDADGYTIVVDERTGYYVYAKSIGEELVPTKHIVGKANPKVLSLRPYANISEEGYREKVRRIKADCRTNDRIEIPHTLYSGLKKKSSDTKGISENAYNLVIFLGFSDVNTFDHDFNTYNSWFNTTSEEDKSMQTYYKHISYGKFNAQSHLMPIPEEGTAVVCYKDPNPRAYYSPYSAANPTGYTSSSHYPRKEALLRGLLDWIKDKIPTDIPLDGDGDGYIDNVAILVAGPSDGWSDLLWPHQSTFSGANQILINGKRTRTYNFSPIKGAAYPYTVAYHEFGHSIGAPDFYRYVNSKITPIGQWSMMSGNVGDFGGYIKWAYPGWIDSCPMLTREGTYYLDLLNQKEATSNQIYRIPSPFSKEEFLLVEYRKGDGYFENFYSTQGILTYRFNQTHIGNAQGGVGDRGDELYIYRSNGTTTATGDLTYPHKFIGQLTDKTNPSLFLSNGQFSGVNLKNISKSDERMKFDLVFTATPFIRVIEEPDMIEKAGGVVEWDVATNVSDWTATSDANWVTLEPDHARGKLKITVARGVLSRLATITLSGGGAEPETGYLVQKNALNDALYIPQAPDNKIYFKGNARENIRLRVMGNVQSLELSNWEDFWIDTREKSGKLFITLSTNNTNTTSVMRKANLKVTNQAGATKTIELIQHTPTSGVEENQIGSSVRIIPSQVEDIFVVKTDGVVEQVTVYSMLGEKLFDRTGEQSCYNVENLSSGTYFVKVKTNQKTETLKIIKK